MSNTCPDAKLIASILDTVEAFFVENGCPFTDAQAAAVANARDGVDQMQRTYLPAYGHKQVAA